MDTFLSSLTRTKKELYYSTESFVIHNITQWWQRQRFLLWVEQTFFENLTSKYIHTYMRIARSIQILRVYNNIIYYFLTCLSNSETHFHSWLLHEIDISIWTGALWLGACFVLFFINFFTLDLPHIVKFYLFSSLFPNLLHIFTFY